MEDLNGTAAPSQITINGTDYSPEDAQNFIESGKQTIEAESKWNTKLDNVWPEYNRLSQEKATWQAEKQKYEQQIATFQTKQQVGTDTGADLEKARAAARQLGITLNEDLEKGGYIKKDDLEKYLGERDQQQRQVQAILDEADKLQKEINATDTPARFNKKAVLAYAQAYNISDLRKAYEEMNDEVLTPWKAAQVKNAQKPSLKTLKGGGGNKQPGETKVDDSNVKDLLKEALWGNNQGQ